MATEEHKQWRKKYAKKRKEYNEKELEWERLKFKEDEKLGAYWDGYFDGRKAQREDEGWKYPDYMVPKRPLHQIPVALDDDDDEEDEMPEGSGDELWQEIYRCEKDEGEDLEDELPGSFGKLMNPILKL